MPIGSRVMPSGNPSRSARLTHLVRRRDPDRDFAATCQRLVRAAAHTRLSSKGSERTAAASPEDGEKGSGELA